MPLPRRWRRCLMAIQPDAGEVAEQRRELRPVGLRQRRLEQRGDVGAQMRGVAGAEQHDIDTRLVPHKAVGGIRHRGGATRMDQKTERVLGLGEPLRNLSPPRARPSWL